MYYHGTKEDKANIDIGNGNNYLKNATWHYIKEGDVVPGLPESDSGNKPGTGQGNQTSVGVSEVTIVNNELIVTLSNGNEYNLGNVKGEKGDQGEKGDKGDPGVSITEVTLTAEGELSMKFSNGQVVPLGNIKGQDGTDGVGIANTEINADGNLVITYTNGEIKDLGSVKGLKGDKGDTGPQGPKGDKGDTGEQGPAGRGIVKTEIIDGHLWITYSDDLENPVDLGKVTNPEYEGTEGLDFYLLPDGTYGVKAGLTRYLENIVIPSVYRGKAVTSIMENGFEGMRNLKTITIPNSITTIEKYAFSDCAVLETAVIPNSVTTIGAYAFNNCVSLSNTVNIPSGITEIPTYCFYNCKGLTTLTIPASVTKIQLYAFTDSGLTSVIDELGGNWKFKSAKLYYMSANYGEQSVTWSNATAPTLSFVSGTKAAEYLAGKKISGISMPNFSSLYAKPSECTFTRVAE